MGRMRAARPPIHETPFTVVVDTNERLPYAFAGLRTNADDGARPISVRTARVKINTGDYTLLELPYITIERKSVPDLFQWMSDRDNVVARLGRMESWDYAAVVVESDIGSIIRDPPRFGSTTPRNLIRSIQSWDQQFKTRWWFLPSRRHAEAWTYRALERYWLHHRARAVSPAVLPARIPDPR